MQVHICAGSAYKHKFTFGRGMRINASSHLNGGVNKCKFTILYFLCFDFKL